MSSAGSRAAGHADAWRPATADRPVIARPPGRALLSGLGQTLLTAGVVLLLFCVYELYVTGLVATRDQSRLARDLAGSWAAGPAPAGPAAGPAAGPVQEGAPFARLYLPRLSGRDPMVVVEGTGVPDLKQGGPGHLTGSALPGDIGNVVLSGHRTTYGAPFGRLDALRPGDPLVVETGSSWFTYRTTGSSVVAPTAVEVTLPVPARPGAVPTERLLTLTTCTPKYSARQRLVVSAVFDGALTKAGGARPDVLQG